jgi:hypothetical protein
MCLGRRSGKGGVTSCGVQQSADKCGKLLVPKHDGGAFARKILDGGCVVARHAEVKEKVQSTVAFLDDLGTISGGRWRIQVPTHIGKLQPPPDEESAEFQGSSVDLSEYWKRARNRQSFETHPTSVGYILNAANQLFPDRRVVPDRQQARGAGRKKKRGDPVPSLARPSPPSSLKTTK